MFVKKNEKIFQALLKDTVARLLFFNALFVILGYGISLATAGASITAVKILKTGFLAGSFIYILIIKSVKQPGRYFDAGNLPFIFCFFILLTILASSNFFDALNKGQTFIIPFLYIYLSLAYLIKNYNVQTILKGIHWAVLIIYSIPPISYILFGGSLSDTNIYGHEEESSQVFVSNHYGWASALYILSFIYVVRNIALSKSAIFLISAVLAIAVVLLFTSANRAALLSIVVTLIPLLFKYKGLKSWHKIAVIVILTGVFLFLLSKPESAVNFIFEKSVAQNENESEKRFQITAIMIDYLNSKPVHWFTGVGIFDYKVMLEKINFTNYHNSYWEILFGLGLPLFGVFLSFMVFTPVYRFIKYYSKYTLLLAPLLIIPYFESNLTAGQFLFFPWFTYMLILNAKLKFWNKAFSIKVSNKNKRFRQTVKNNRSIHLVDNRVTPAVNKQY